MNRTVKTLAVGASLLACAGIANAATYEVNLTGASAQFNFWNDAAKKFLENTYSCTGVVQAQTVDGKRGYSKSTSCSGGNTYIIRYTSNASYDGVTALKGTQDPDSCNGGSGTILRKYADDTVAPDASGKIANTAVVCKPTVVGASDVNASSFTQVSKGMKLGALGNPNTDLGGVTPTDNVYGPTGTSTTNTLTVISADATGLTNNAQHLAVPFAFYVNKGVTWKKCSTSAASNAGGYCMTDADCGNTSGACASQTIDNLSRLQAVLLFSGQITNWNQFGGYFDAKPVILCLRHAGSGTHSTLDNAVMKSSWGKGLTQAQKNNWTTNGNAQTYNVTGINGGTSTLNYIWFNNGTADEKNCLDGQIYDTVLGAKQSGRADLGVVGYMDADQPDASNYVQVKYQGVKASRQALRNGWYDFFTMQNMYYNTADSTNYTPVAGVVSNLITFAQNPANIPDGTGFTGANESAFWATKGELRILKSSDSTYPATKVTPTSPQTP